MIVLIEAYHYEASALEVILDAGRYGTPVGGNRIKLNYVGYCQEMGKDHSVLILPKVFLDKSQKLLGGYSPEDLLNVHLPDSNSRQRLQQDRLPNHLSKLDFLFRFSVWLYRAIRQFRTRHADSILPEIANLLNVTDAGHTGLSELEIVMALVRFHQENNTLLTHIKRVNTAQQHTVSWSRTVSRQQPMLQNGRPVYTEPVVKQKHVNYDEELIVLYLSTLRDLQQQFGFRLDLNPLYTLLSAREMDRFRARATRRLTEIRGKYFSDKLLQVWKLLYQYYARQERLKSNKPFREVLLVRDFNVVFEDMIDYLLADPNEKLHTRLKDQPDGKIVDHIYPYQDLIRPDENQIYHIGDSKYYRAENEVGDASVFKQYTYARNVIQYNINLLNKDGYLPNRLRYRDDLTEGYNPTPNFFISALVNDTLDFNQDSLTHRQSYNENRHFDGRLFDRDTLLLQAYNINFLYVLNNYVAGNATDRERFRNTTRRRFRDELITYLNKHYTFWQVTPVGESLETFVQRHFWAFRGQLYRPSNLPDSLIVAQPVPKSISPPIFAGVAPLVQPYALY